MKDQINILMIEDDPADVNHIKELLDDSVTEEFSFCYTNTLSGGIEKLGNSEIDVVILDLSLPDSSGIDTFNAFSEYSKQVPVIVMTDIEEESVALAAMRSGAQDYILKGSISSGRLINSIVYSIERKQLQHLVVKEKNLVKEAYEKLKTHSSLLINTDRMSTVGVLANGIAQELNSPIMGINSAIQYCLENTSDDNEIYQTLKEAEKATIYCAEIVKNLISFSSLDQKTDNDFQKKNIKEIIDEVIGLVQYRIENQGVSFVLECEDDIPELWISSVNLKQVFLDLATNSLDAMEESEDKNFGIYVRKDGENVEIIVEDSGSGISSENLQMIFEPFFTTKSLEKGTGLGLSICKGIINEHSGMITFESEINVGTKVKILLPIDRRSR